MTIGRSPRALAWALPLTYLGCAALFVSVYTSMTRWIMDMGAFTHDGAPFPFRYRILVLALARAFEGAVPLAASYAAIATLSVFVFLLAYDRLLATFVRRDAARVLALGILYPLCWNYLGLNRMYFPFDMPGLALFTLGLLFLARRRWPLYYLVFALATVNRETTWFLAVLMLFVEWGRMPARTLVLHVVAQAALWIAIKFALAQAYPGGPQFANMVAKNVETWTGMLTLHGSGAKDWAKFLLMFGGTWMLVPFVYREQPRFVKRTLLALPVFVLPMLVVGTIDEARVYAEWVPLLATPVLLALARRLGEAVA